MRAYFSLFVCLVMIVGCDVPSGQSTKVEDFKSAEIKNEITKPSFVGDEKAVALANEVLMASGGQEAWDQTNFLQWNFSFSS